MLRPAPSVFRRMPIGRSGRGSTFRSAILANTQLKNIAEPMRIYSLRGRRPGEGGHHHAPNRAAQATAASPAAPMALPEKPSIAVLPFTNMSGDPEQEYFADGITEDLITALSRIRWFFVIARNSSFAYKGKSPDIRAVARELGVAYVLEGSVRKAGNRVRVTAQLIEGASGNHVWAQRYDRDLEDIFAVQDEITATLVGAIEPELGKAERERARAKRPDDLRAWDLYQRGLWHTYRRTREDLAEAQLLFRQAIEIDPGLARAYAAAEEAFFFQHVGGYVDSGDAAKAAALRFAETAVQIDGQDAFNRYALGRALTLVRRHDAAVFELARRSSSSQALPRPTTRSAWRSPPADARRKRCRTSSWRCVSARRTHISGSSWCDALRHISSWDGWRRRSSRPSGRCANQTSSGLAGRYWPPRRRISGDWKTRAAASRPCTPSS